MEKISIDTENIQLDQFLKWAGVIASGGEVKPMLADGLIRRNGEKETARRRQLHPGDIIEIEGMGSGQVVRDDK